MSPSQSIDDFAESAVTPEPIPVNEVREPSLVQNIVTMFQIHKLRLDWELMPTALKVEVLMDETDDKNNRRLASLTGLDEAVVVRCKKLLSYSDKYRDTMLDADPAKRMKADFFIELYVVLTDRSVRTFSWYRKEPFIDKMIVKFESGGLKSVTDFRIVKQHITNAVKAGKTTIMSRLLREFADDPKLTVTHLDIEAASVDAEARKIERIVDQLTQQLTALDVNEVYGELEMWDKLESLVELIRAKLRAVDRREPPPRRTRTQVCDAWNDPSVSYGELLANVGKVYLILVAATNSAIDRIQDDTLLIVLSPHHIDSVRDNIFHTKNFSDGDRRKILNYCKLASPNNPRGWRDCGLVVVFSHRTPNNSIPILHAESGDWSPIFPRHD